MCGKAVSKIFGTMCSKKVFEVIVGNLYCKEVREWIVGMEVDQWIG